MEFPPFTLVEEVQEWFSFHLGDELKNRLIKLSLWCETYFNYPSLLCPKVELHEEIWEFLKLFRRYLALQFASSLKSKVVIIFQEAWVFVYLDGYLIEEMNYQWFLYSPLVNHQLRLSTFLRLTDCLRRFKGFFALQLIFVFIYWCFTDFKIKLR